MIRLAQFDLKYLKGVGDVRASLLSKELEIKTLRDLLYYFPTRYVDRSRFYPIAEIRSDTAAVQVKGRFVGMREEGEGKRRRLIGLFSDGRSVMEAVWFHKLKAISSSLRGDTEYVLFAKPNFFNGKVSMVHPEVETFHPEKPQEGLRGVYPLTEVARKRGVSSRMLHQLMLNAFAHPAFAAMQETLPPEIVEQQRLMPLPQAIMQMHNPDNPETLQRARERMKFEELFYVELHILRFSRARGLSVPGFRFTKIGPHFSDYHSQHIPFELTGAQKRVLKEIWGDMRSGIQMNRLLQGDVGSGKTMVAFLSMLMAIDNGTQAAIMAPTEILAGQHYEVVRQWGAAIGLEVRLLTGSIRGKERREILQAVEEGSTNILIGTHALLEEGVKFARLGLAVIDEQHRFGVAQRARLWDKGETAPHVLVMTATPIPRTLAMTVYGDLQVSVIDELPPGRKPVQTLLRYVEKRADINQLINRELQAGRQIYFVYPLIKENESLDLKSLEEGYEQVCAAFGQYGVGCLHGQMKPEEKERQMQRFVAGETRILVATTVIEVGVNVPNASVMVIENAERFGLSQLHQLRGRVGRGSDNSYCILVTKYKISADTRKRLTVMTETSDGFVVSEADLQLRGPGDMEGTQQSGIAFNLRVADLARDGQIISQARDVAGSILDAYPQLVADKPQPSDATMLTLVRELDFRFSQEHDWSRIS